MSWLLWGFALLATAVYGSLAYLVYRVTMRYATHRKRRRPPGA